MADSRHRRSFTIKEEGEIKEVDMNVSSNYGRWGSGANSIDVITNPASNEGTPDAPNSRTKRKGDW